MTKRDQLERCKNCDDNSNGWCKVLSTNSLDVKMYKCPLHKPKQTQMTEEEFDRLIDFLSSNPYRCEELSKLLAPHIENFINPIFN